MTVAVSNAAGTKAGTKGDDDEGAGSADGATAITAASAGDSSQVSATHLAMAPHCSSCMPLQPFLPPDGALLVQCWRPQPPPALLQPTAHVCVMASHHPPTPPHPLPCFTSGQRLQPRQAPQEAAAPAQQRRRARHHHCLPPAHAAAHGRRGRAACGMLWGADRATGSGTEQAAGAAGSR